jgi:hypothetical protein
MALIQSRGKLTFLRVHDRGTRYGPPGDSIDVEVVIKLDTEPGKAFGFQLRDDGDGPARRGMLDLLRDAMTLNSDVLVDYNLDPGLNNGIIIRTALVK